MSSYRHELKFPITPLDAAIRLERKERTGGLGRKMSVTLDRDRALRLLEGKTGASGQPYWLLQLQIPDLLSQRWPILKTEKEIPKIMATATAIFNFADIFKSKFLENATTNFSLVDTLLGLGLSFLIGLFIFMVYKKPSQGSCMPAVSTSR